MRTISLCCFEINLCISTLIVAPSVVQLWADTSWLHKYLAWEQNSSVMLNMFHTTIKSELIHTMLVTWRLIFLRPAHIIKSKPDKARYTRSISIGEVNWISENLSNQSINEMCIFHLRRQTMCSFYFSKVSYPNFGWIFCWCCMYTMIFLISFFLNFSLVFIQNLIKLFNKS